VIIFSQWEEMLDIIEVALRCNKIRSFRGKGQGKAFNAAVEGFRREADEHAALLLPVKSGGQGLTLNEATQIFLADPLLSAAVRRQVVSRNHRVGQTRETVVHSYVTKGTVEEAVDALVDSSASSASSSSLSSSAGAQKLGVGELKKLLGI
jgi:E3 ubiquitin-protein ligase SHPRH